MVIYSMDISSEQIYRQSKKRNSLVQLRQKELSPQNPFGCLESLVIYWELQR